MLTATGRLFIWFWLVFIFLPRQIFSPPFKGESRVWFDIVRMSFYTILIVYALVYFRIYDVFSLAASYLLLYFFLLFIRPPVGLPLTDMERLLSRFSAFGIDVLERNVNYGDMARKRKARIKDWVIARIARKDLVLWASGIILVVAGSIYLRLADITFHAAHTASFYDHYQWMKALTRNQLSLEGAYPSGAYCLVHVLKQFSLMDEETVLRCFQGMAGALTVGAIYFALRNWSGRRDGALLGASLYGIFSFSGLFSGLPLPADQSLPFELALAFMLPTWVFMIRFLTERKTVWLAIAFQGTATVFMISPFVGTVTLAGCLLAIPVSMVHDRYQIGKVPPVTVAIFGLLVLGGLFFVLLDMGDKQFITVSMALAAGTASRMLSEIAKLPEVLLSSQVHLFMVILLFTPLLFIPAGCDRCNGVSTGTRTGRTTLALVLMAVVVLYEGWRIGWTGTLSDPAMTKITALLVCSAGGLLYAMPGSWIALWVTARARSGEDKKSCAEGRSYLSFFVAAMVLAVTFTVLSPHIEIHSPPRVGYDVVPLKIYEIAKRHRVHTWTIVGDTEVVPHLHGKGWFISGQDFLNNYPVKTYRYDPDRPDISIPTEHVFIIAENNTFAIPSVSHESQFKNGVHQALKEWGRSYMKNNAETEIYYQDNQITIFYIHQSGYSNKAIPYFKLRELGGQK